MEGRRFMRERMGRFMIGRNGIDDLGRFLNIVILTLLILGMFVSSLLSSLGMMLLIYQYFRVFSRNVYKRSAENKAYLQLRNRIGGWFSVRKKRVSQCKDYRFYTCPSCKQNLRVPRGKGKISLTCPKCRTQFERKS